MNDKKLMVALDVDTFDEARQLVDVLSEAVDVFKVGSQLFTACGPVIVRHILARQKQVFLDLKYHDIPNTVANAVSSAVGLCADVHQVMTEDGEKVNPDPHLFMMTLHTLGGEEMLKRAVEAATKKSETIGVRKPLLVGITVLTSTAKMDNIQNVVLERARLAQASGLDGVVASSQEAAMLRKEFGKDFVIVTPGIRPAGAEIGDQKRVTTPAEAITNGSDCLVIGRPIVHAADPLEAARQIRRDMDQAC